MNRREVAAEIGLMSDFDTFWAAYPRRTARFAAEKAFKKARTLATMDELLTGVENYIRHKPDYADFAHASSWLNAGRWLDQWEAPQSAQATVEGRKDCQHEPKCVSNEWHAVLVKREQERGAA